VLPLLLVAAALGAETPGVEKIIWVGHHQVECPGSPNQLCFLVKEEQYAEWQWFAGSIEGFDYEEGFGYELRVRVEPSERVGDAHGNLSLRLLEVRSRIDAFSGSQADATAQYEPRQDLPQPPQEPAPRPATEGRIRGHLTVGHGVEARSFKLCGHDRSLWIVDDTSDDLWQLYRDLTDVPNRPLFLEVEGRLEAAPKDGFGAHYPRQLTVTKVYRATAEGWGCRESEQPYLVRAFGNEPSWNVLVAADGIALAEPDRSEPLLFPYAPPSVDGAKRIYTTRLDTPKVHELELMLEKADCFDSMVDARYSYRAYLTLDGRWLSGCAVEGSTLSEAGGRRQ
jgi:uncharacterized membrane protein